MNLLQTSVETRNKADSLVYQTEKTLEEIGDKLPDADKADVNSALEKLKETLKSGSIDDVKADTEALEQAFYKLSEKLYAQNAGAQDPGAAGNGGAGDNTYYDTDFEDKT